MATSAGEGPAPKRIARDVLVREARREELDQLQAELAKQAPDYEQLDLHRAVVMVAEDPDGIFAFLAARQVWQFEPLLVVSKRRRSLLAKASYFLLRSMEEYLREASAVGFVFAHITRRSMWKLAAHWGFSRLYPGGRLYGKDLQ